MESKIPTTFLPEGWSKIVAEKFGCSQSKIERIVYGLTKRTKKNSAIFEHMLSLAEEGEKANEALNERLNALIQ